MDQVLDQVDGDLREAELPQLAEACQVDQPIELRQSRLPEAGVV